MATTVESNELKAIVKEALLEIIQEWRGLVHDIVEEALEDIALIHAIEEGKDTHTASRDEIILALTT